MASAIVAQVGPCREGLWLGERVPCCRSVRINQTQPRHLARGQRNVKNTAHQASGASELFTRLKKNRGGRSLDSNQFSGRISLSGTQTRRLSNRSPQVRIIGGLSALILVGATPLNSPMSKRVRLANISSAAEVMIRPFRQGWATFQFGGGLSLDRSGVSPTPPWS